MQGDLNQVLYASQGEFARVVVIPGDVEECFYETFRAFNLAEKYQLPCLVLTDKYLADSSLTCPFFEVNHLMIERGKLVDEAWLAANQPYLRYRQSPDGVSERALSGQSDGRHIATSYTHGEDGFYSSGNKEYAAEEPAVTVAGIDKSFAKLPQLLIEVPGAKLYGQDSADLTVVAWGSTKGAVLEAVEQAKAAGLQVNFLHILYASPFPAEQTASILAKSKRILLVEGNKTAQLGALLRSQTGFSPTAMYLKYDSRPFTPAGILGRIYDWYRNRIYRLDTISGYDSSLMENALQVGSEWGEKIPVGIFYCQERMTLEESLPQLKEKSLVALPVNGVDITSLMREHT